MNPTLRALLASPTTARPRADATLGDRIRADVRIVVTADAGPDWDPDTSLLTEPRSRSTWSTRPATTARA